MEDRPNPAWDDCYHRSLNRIRIPRFPPLVWLLLTGTLLTRSVFFMVWPFLAVLLDRQFRLPPAQIGSILTLASAAGVPLGFYSGNLSDRFGRPRIITTACAVTTAAFVILATARTVSGFAVGAFLVGLCRGAIESPTNALIADLTEEAANRELAFHARYFLINVGGAVGPLTGFLFGLTARQPTFWITGLIYSLYTIGLVSGFRKMPQVPHHAAERARLQLVIRVLRNDSPFLFLLLANFLSMLAYAQQESTLVQYLNLNGPDVVLKLYTALIFTNTLTIVCFQFPLLRLLRAIDFYTRAYTGLALFAAGFVIFALLPVHTFSGWILGMWVLSMGEAILFPTLNLQVDRMAPAHLKGSYFGASALGGLGFAVGPLVGGFLLQYIGGSPTFAFTALLTGLGGLSYWKSSRVAAHAAQ